MFSLPIMHKYNLYKKINIYGFSRYKYMIGREKKILYSLNVNYCQIVIRLSDYSMEVNNEVMDELDNKCTIHI